VTPLGNGGKEPIFAVLHVAGQSRYKGELKEVEKTSQPFSPRNPEGGFRGKKARRGFNKARCAGGFFLTDWGLLKKQQTKVKKRSRLWEL